MARPRTTSKPRPKRKKQSETDREIINVNGYTGMQVPEAKAKRIAAAHVSGMPATQICKAFNCNWQTVQALLRNRPHLLQAARDLQRTSDLFVAKKHQHAAPKAVCAPLNRTCFAGPVSANAIADVFPYLRHADFSAQHCGVYFLFLDSECVYVGKSSCVAARCGQHLYHNSFPTKIFDRALYVPVDAAWLDAVERALIVQLQPKHNFQRKHDRLPEESTHINGKTQDQIQAQAQAA